MSQHSCTRLWHLAELLKGVQACSLRHVAMQLRGRRKPCQAKHHLEAVRALLGAAEDDGAPACKRTRAQRQQRSILVLSTCTLGTPSFTCSQSNASTAQSEREKGQAAVLLCAKTVHGSMMAKPSEPRWHSLHFTIQHMAWQLLHIALRALHVPSSAKSPG